VVGETTAVAVRGIVDRASAQKRKLHEPGQGFICFSTAKRMEGDMKVAVCLAATLTLLYAVVVHAENGADFISREGKVHESNKVECAACHLNGTEKIAPDSACYTCHGTYEDMAKATAELKPNPHDAHIGQIRCTLCHSTHKPSKVYCDECHTFWK